MATLRVFQRTSRASARAFSSTSNVAAKEAASNPFAGLNARCQDTAKQHRQFMLKKPLNPHLTNTTSTIANAFPSLGEDKPPADQLTSANPDFLPKDSVPENQERMTGGTQAGGPKKGPNAELDVGEIEGGTFKVEPHKRTGEKERDMRARLLYQSRKRGTLESDLLCSTFAAKHLPTMTMSQMQQYDLFLDENDWDIYYWATQDPSQQHTEPQVPLSGELQAGKTAAQATADGSKKKSKRRKPTPEEKEDIVPGLGQVRAPSPAEWSGTVGTFKPAYRPVPARWKSSEILSMLRKHVMENSAGGVHEEHDPKVGGEGLSQAVQGTGGKGLGFMPELKPME